MVPAGTEIRIVLERSVHQVEAVFLATAVHGHTEPGCVRGTAPVLPDGSQVGSVWLPLAELGRLRFFPRALTSFLTKDGIDAVPGYVLDRA